MTPESYPRMDWGLRLAVKSVKIEGTKPKGTKMTEQNIPDVTEAERRLARKFAKSVEANRGNWNDTIRAAARVILDSASVPTMADMSEEERAACRWMQCDAGPYGRRGLIVRTGEWAVYVTDKETGVYSNYSPDLVTALPDLPRMEWNGDREDVTPAPRVGNLIESAADPRVAALPVGSILLDRHAEATTKRLRGWTGRGYHPIPSQGCDFGPWTVLHIPKEDS